MDWIDFLSQFRGIHTLIMIVVFIGICVWAFSPKRREKNNEAAHLIFDDDEVEGRTRANQQEKQHNE